MSDRRPRSIAVIPEWRNLEERMGYRALLRMRESDLIQFLGGLGVEHAQMKSERLRDPRFERYYERHGIQFLDVIERSYLRKLTAGQISLDDFFDAMRAYIASRNSGSQGSRRRSEAEHNVHHVLAQLVQNFHIGRRETEKSSKSQIGQEPRRRPGMEPSGLEGALRDLGKSYG